ncbi:MAG: hypothetical protein ACWA47_09365 [Brevirhabdus sp.]
MSGLVLKEELLAQVPGLTAARLDRMVEIKIVTPVEGRTSPAFAEPDVARICLACELADSFDMNEDALEIVIALTDKLHAMRADLRVLMQAIEEQPRPTRADIGQAMLRLRGVS